ncbi:portal protein [Bacillus pseudomycoides]|uniref:Portal protein n=2 Tax=Bacillus pseudomycoides TaxID=64104 RepID=A0A2A8CAV7_9BACI|nr:phage portal protein [Bacillus pseudomycoides]PEJ75191.1 portal protein [Bacillus pseudomycoides]PEM73251.1 portal protein [Bacillus pseudomycoides]PFW67980.1 portal protein [Bacillus pseudomycoides]PFW80001.1 portal protein [Bacillus pseudomycoides]PFZ48226.1 portal protein [Bacillus pseudomycoides]
MFKTIANAVRRLFTKMGLIKGMKKVTDNRKITIDEESYKQIDIWKAIYSGHFAEWHDLKYQTIEGQKTRRMASLNMAKVVSQEMASLIFNEKCSINISDETLFNNIKNVLDDNNFTREFQRYLEYMLALGGMVIKVYWDNGIKLSYVTADCFVPVSWDNNKVTEGVFINESTKGDKYYTLLEWHLIEGTQHVIKNELYESKNKGELGTKVSLSILYADLEEEVRIDDLSKPMFVYFKPNTANNFDLYSPLGISIYANSLDVLKSLDIAFDSFQREFVLGKKRIIVPASAIKYVTDPISGQQQRYFDASDEVYEAMKFEENQEIKDISVELRVEEHKAAINALLNYYSMQTGFSTGAFSFDGQGVKTATEVVSENSKTFKTKQSHETIIEDGIRDLVDIVIEVASLYDEFESADEYEVTVTFDDSIAEDQAAEINKQILLVTNNLTTKKKAIMKIHGVSEEEATQMLEEITEENRMALPENVDFFGLEGNQQKNNDPGAE